MNVAKLLEITCEEIQNLTIKCYWLNRSYSNFLNCKLIYFIPNLYFSTHFIHLLFSIINFYQSSILNGRFRPHGRPIFPSDSQCRIIFSFFAGKGVLISSTGGSALIFLPWIPVFLCHKPDLGAIPRQRFLLGEPTTPSLRGCMDTFPITHWHRWSEMVVLKSGIRFTINLILRRYNYFIEIKSFIFT